MEDEDGEGREEQDVGVGGRNRHSQNGLSFCHEGGGKGIDGGKEGSRHAGMVGNVNEAVCGIPEIGGILSTNESSAEQDTRRR